MRPVRLATLWLSVAVAGLSTAVRANDDITIFQVEGAGGVPINVAESGDRDKPGILFIHGNGQSYLSWHRQLDSDLAERFHLVAYDLRGHGNSGKPFEIEAYSPACVWAEDIDAVIQATGLSNPVVVAWSRGGLIAMHYVSCRGTDALSGLVMVAARGRLVEVPLPPSDSPARVSQEQLESQDIEDNLKGAKTFARLMTVEEPDPEWLEKSVVMNLLAPPYARRAMRAPTIGPDGAVSRSYAHLIDEINVPIMIMLGADDPLRDSGDLAAAYRAAIPTVTVHMYPGVGHSPFLEVPDKFNADLADFVSGAMK